MQQLSMPISDHDVERFWSRVEKTPYCWTWIPVKGGGGYGTFRIGDTLYRTQVIAWMLERGAIPMGFTPRQTCDNPACVRFEHLHLIKDAETVRERYASQAVTYEQLAREYGTSPSTIWRMVHAPTN